MASTLWLCRDPGQRSSVCLCVRPSVYWGCLSRGCWPLQEQPRGEKCLSGVVVVGGVAEVVGKGSGVISLISFWVVLMLGTSVSLPRLGFPRVHGEIAMGKADLISADIEWLNGLVVGTGSGAVLPCASLWAWLENGQFDFLVEQDMGVCVDMCVNVYVLMQVWTYVLTWLWLT